jgi:hypothetical protein
MLLSSFMIEKAFKIELVFEEFILSIFYLGLLTYKFSVALFLHLFILVAFIETSSMSIPVCQANPTEIMRANFTFHMIASLILLNSIFALRTLFRICHYPEHVVAFVRILNFPHFWSFTRAWAMRLLCALKAKWVAAFAIDFTSPQFF